MIQVAKQAVTEALPQPGALAQPLDTGKLAMNLHVNTAVKPSQLAVVRYDKERGTLVPVLAQWKVADNGAEASFQGLPGETYLAMQYEKTFPDME
ncbi:hypothetical protein AMS62_18710 [Bacillus sp. FJAT-18019]|nr:hypothetical protein AMS62_18710 [Bacillus sp. FJAT-18019]